MHTMILWRQIEKILLKVPARFISTRLDEFRARAAFIRREVAPSARGARQPPLVAAPRSTTPQ